jgi:hypothetical protein
MATKVKKLDNDMKEELRKISNELFDLAGRAPGCWEYKVHFHEELKDEIQKILKYLKLNYHLIKVECGLFLLEVKGV